MEILTRFWRMSQVSLMFFFGSGIQRSMNALSEVSLMICSSVRRSLAAIWAFIKKVLSSSRCSACDSESSTCTDLQVVEVPCPDPLMNKPTLRSDQDWLTLQTSGLEEVRAVSASSEGTHERMLFSVLDSIGLIKLLTDVWRWQDVKICQSFVRHWDRRTQTTKVSNIPIDVSYQNFITLTGLDGTRSIETGSLGRSVRRSSGGAKRKRNAAFIEALTSVAPIFYALRNDPLLHSLLRFFNHTLWFTNDRCYYPTTEMVDLLVQHMKGKKEKWSRFIYGKFIREIQDLQHQHENHPDKKLQTLAGPVMCFLFSEAKHKYEARKNKQIARLSSFAEDVGAAAIKEAGYELYNNQLLAAGLTCPESPKFPTTTVGRKRTSEITELNEPIPPKARQRKRISEPEITELNEPVPSSAKPRTVLPCQVSELKLPFPPSSMAMSRKRTCESELLVPRSNLPKKPTYEISPRCEAALNLCLRKPSSSKSHQELQTDLENKVSQLVVAEGFGVSEEEEDLLSKAFEEQKRRQERFKLHLRSSWQRPFNVPCGFGCCPGPTHNPKHDV